MVRREEVESREEHLRLRIRELPDDLKQLYFRQSKSRIKDPDTYAVLNYLSIAGLHHFYVGRWSRGFFNLSVFIGGLLLVGIGGVTVGVTCVGIGLIALAAVFLVELPALFNSQVVIQDHNNTAMEQLLDDLDPQQQARNSNSLPG
ncbi:MAG: hypothetical protein OSB47_02615 [Pirellulaceae bacterium]|nr:hypothetical protein [Pirellulaceae bacterium]